MLALAATALLFCAGTVLSFPAAAADHEETSQLIDSVSGERIISTVSELQNFGSRAFYLNSSQKAAAYIFERFQDLGLNVEYQNLTASGHQTSNVIATLEGSSPGKARYLFGAHYDSFNSLSSNYSGGANTSAPGADDDASGVAAVIELASELAPLKLKQTVMFVAFGAEELNPDLTGDGLAGSTAFVKMATASGLKFEGTAILDMIGYRTGTQDRCTLIVRPDGNPLVNATQMAVAEYGLGLELRTISNSSISFSDHWPFWMADYPSMLVIEEVDQTTYYPANPFYHTSDDRAYHLSESQMASMTKALLGAVLSLDAGLLEENASDEVVTGAVIVIVAVAVAVGVMIYFRERRA